MLMNFPQQLHYITYDIIDKRHHTDEKYRWNTRPETMNNLIEYLNMDNEKIISEISDLKIAIINTNKYLGRRSMFVGGMWRGAGMIAGAVLFVIVAGWILKLMGFMPGLSDIAEKILEAYERAKL